MSLAAGSRLGAYEIVSLLGAGGMGEVYKARDTRLDRTVAVKVMPAAVAADPQFRARFDREARAISQLQHPHICTLHDVGEVDGTAFLVMELLQGQTLADRLTKGALPVDEALKIAIEVADALSAAHKQGIVHRDLKPANIMLTKSGAKMLDFGLAKAAAPVVSIGATSTQETTSTHLTGVGTILGTLQYMAPEQVEGHDADARSDIWALGAVLYEMLTGAPAFSGESSAGVVSAILKDRPLPLRATNPAISATLDHLVSRCLQKEPDERWQNATDVHREFAWLATEGGSDDSRPASVSPNRVRPTRLWSLVAVASLTVVALTGGWALATSRSAPASRPLFVSIAPPGGPFGPRLGPAISPDGTTIAFWAPDVDGVTHLYVRRLDEPDARPLPGTEGPEETTGARSPTWSPDGRSLAFFSRGRLRRIDLAGGPPIALTEAGGAPRGVAWGAHGDLLFVPNSGARLLRMPAAGGTAAPVDLGSVGSVAEWPSFLPDGVHFLFTHAVEQGDQNALGIYVGSLEREGPVRIATTLSRAEYADGFLYFSQDGALYRQQFDLTARQLSGEPVRVIDDIGSMGGDSAAYAFSVAHNGTIVTANSPLLPLSRVQVIDRQGRTLRTLGSTGQFYGIAVSRDWQHILVEHGPQHGIPNNNVWSIDASAGVETLAIRDAAVPIFARTGDRVLFRTRANTLAVANDLNESDEQTVLVTGLPGRAWPEDWSPDGSTALVRVDAGATQADLWTITVDGSRPAAPYLHTSDNEYQARFSPNGKWVAYVSDESGQDEVYVERYPTPRQKTRISTAGGTQPVWRADGRELYYMAADRTFVAVGLDSEAATVQPQRIERLFALPPLGSAGTFREQIAASRDGQQFLMNLAVPTRAPGAVKVVLNWREPGRAR